MITHETRPMSTVLVVDDDDDVRRALHRVLTPLPADVVCVADAPAALQVSRHRAVDVVVADYKMPDLTGLDLLALLRKEGVSVPFILITGYGTVDNAIRATRAGVAAFLQKPLDPSGVRGAVAQAVEQGRIERELRVGRDATSPARRFLGDTPVVRRLCGQIERAAQSTSTVLIEGESGTGKELVAQAVHDLSPRRQLPFVRINCAALPDGLVESALFGHERGAFTGAMRRVDGAFTRANTGSILLDEVSEMRPELQAKMLRVLQEREFERVGGSEVLQVDVRIIATTNRDLRLAVDRGDFRQDLYYRLNVLRLRVPPLRDRIADVVPLARYFAVQAAVAHGRAEQTISEEALVLLQAGLWPGNVRELKHAVERAVVLADGPVLLPEHFDLDTISAEPPPAHREPPHEAHHEAPRASHAAARGPAPGDFNLATAERALIAAALEATGGNRTQAAHLLGLHPRTLRKKLNRRDDPAPGGPTDDAAGGARAGA